MSFDNWEWVTTVSLSMTLVKFAPTNHDAQILSSKVSRHSWITRFYLFYFPNSMRAEINKKRTCIISEESQGNNDKYIA